MSLTIEDYSEKAIALRGDTKPFKDNIMGIGGKFNSNLRGSAGWIFPKSKKEAVEDLIAQIENGDIIGNENEEKNTRRATPVSERNGGSIVRKENTSSSINTRDFVSRKDYLDLLTRIEKLEAICSQLDFVPADVFTSGGNTTEIILEESEEQEEKSLPTSLLKSRKIKAAKNK